MPEETLTTAKRKTKEKNQETEAEKIRIELIKAMYEKVKDSLTKKQTNRTSK